MKFELKSRTLVTYRIPKQKLMFTITMTQLTMKVMPKTATITTTLPKLTTTKFFKQMPTTMINTATKTKCITN